MWQFEPSLKIVIVHNTYRQPGGEDTVVSAEKDLLSQAGNEVREYLRHNTEINPGGTCSNIALGMRTVWSASSRNELSRLIRECKPDIAHFHNTFPLISPAAYYACRDFGVPVVQTLHNYRLFCSAATFFREGKICEDCLGKGRWQAVRHACYRQSRSASATVVAMLSFHHWYGTWTKLVDCYIALSEFSRTKFIDAGLPVEKIVVKPNFVLPDPGVGRGLRENAVYLGRLSEEKGLRTLLKAWAQVNPSFTLHIIGDGPMLVEIRSQITRSGLSNVRLEGRLSREASLKVLQSARVVILPSSCYENCPMTSAEAFACATPVIASCLGALEEIVHDGRTGLHFRPGDAEDLARKIEWALAHPNEMFEMGQNARAEYEKKYTAEGNYKMLMDIYKRAIQQRTKALKFQDKTAVRVAD